jgi:deoxyribose-phosphate aldolase
MADSNSLLPSTSQFFRAAVSMLRAGADRLGTSSGVSIVAGASTAAGAY